jgi:alcohol dehydrogenase
VHGVVVAVEATGVCRSDWHAWQGHDPDVTLPHVPGHELAGTVVAVGADVRRFRPGDRVGLATVCEASIRCLRRRGRHVQIGLLPDTATRPAVPMDLVIARELQVLGSHGMAAHDYPRLLALVGSGRFPLSGLVRRTLPLEAGPRALAEVGNAANAGVTVLLPGDTANIPGAPVVAR